MRIGVRASGTATQSAHMLHKEVQRTKHVKHSKNLQAGDVHVCAVCTHAGNSLKGGILGSSSSSRSDLATDFRALSTHVASALSRHQQQTASLNSQLTSCQATQQQLQQQLMANEAQMRELRDCLSAAEASKQTAVQAAVAQTEARYGRRLVKVEAKVLGMVSNQTSWKAAGQHAVGVPCAVTAEGLPPSQLPIILSKHPTLLAICRPRCLILQYHRW